ncbi:LCP family protein [Candidatus Curtissbacteria bacterium]|nr:LCP family protein [Candidatus Curtissbacteria bacterium]
MSDLGSKKRRISVFNILAFSAILTILAVILIKFFNLDKYIFKGPATVIQLITDTGLKNDNGRINILLLGTGGAGHEGPDLTDTIILASIEKNGKDVVLISIPRDLWAPSQGAKINAAYAFGQEKGQGLQQAKKTVSELFGIPAHYALRVEFDGFTKAIDQVGGLDLEVENTFTDPKYPIPSKEEDTCGLTIEDQEKDSQIVKVVKDATGSAMLLSEINDQNNPFTCRYETITFKKGPAHFDGVTALKFVRSRYGTNDEGSDFARSARQQKIILAFRQKVISQETFASPKTILDLANTFGQSIDTDVSSSDVPLFLKLFQKIDPSTIRRVVLDQGRKESVLESGDPASYQGQFVLVPKGGSWTDLAEYVQGEIFKLEEN